MPFLCFHVIFKFTKNFIQDAQTFTLYKEKWEFFLTNPMDIPKSIFEQMLSLQTYASDMQ